MLVIVSDLHLTDGTSGHTIKENAFRIFADRIRDTAFYASWRKGGRYRPVERVDILLLGDILDVIRSTAWLEGEDGARPWSNPTDAAFVGKVEAISYAILHHNEPSLAHLGNLTRPGGFELPPPGGRKGEPQLNEPGLQVEVGIHYMVGNHDWFYHLPHAAYHPLRSNVVQALGLENDSRKGFPHGLQDSAKLAGILRAHGVLARHGDIFDPFNFSVTRDESSLGDGVVVELLNRFHLEVRDRLGSRLPRPFIDGLRELDNVRPLAAVPVWIDALLRENSVSGMQAERVKGTWNDLVDDFLNLEFIRKGIRSSTPSTAWTCWNQHSGSREISRWERPALWVRGGTIARTAPANPTMPMQPGRQPSRTWRPVTSYTAIPITTKSSRSTS